MNEDDQPPSKDAFAAIDHFIARRRKIRISLTASLLFLYCIYIFLMSSGYEIADKPIGESAINVGILFALIIIAASFGIAAFYAYWANVNPVPGSEGSSQ